MIRLLISSFALSQSSHYTPAATKTLPFAKTVSLSSATKSVAQRLPTTTSLYGVTEAVVLSDYTAAAIGYYNNIRVPASFLVGSSLAALFMLKAEVSVENMKEKNTWEKVAVFVYHLLALTSSLFSLNVVITATATANFLLLRNKAPLASSAHDFLIRETNYEFLLTRCCFYVSLLSFVACTAIRLVLEFKLFRRKNKETGFIATFSVAALFFHLLSFIDQRLGCAPNLAVMSYRVLRMYFAQALESGRPIEFLSMASFLAAVFMGLRAFWVLFREKQDDVFQLEEPEKQ